jgi:hypothetical protein
LDVIKAIESGEPFTLIFVTADRRRGTGGELITLENWCKKAPGTTPKTVRLFNPDNAETHPITVHHKLIQFFNGKRVIN